ncbi:MAG: Fe-S cluster assembly protein SufD [Pseudomonadota bacterium]
MAAKAEINRPTGRLEADMPESGAWLTEARQAAHGRASALGLPVRRDEYWKYTNPEALVSSSAEGKGSAALGVFDGIQAEQVKVAGGSLAGNGFETLAQAGASDIHWAKDLYGVLEAAGQAPVARPLLALNTAYASDGLVLKLDEGETRQIALTHEPGEAAAYHHVVRVASGATLTVLEDGHTGSRDDIVWEVDLADGASFHHIRVQDAGDTVVNTGIFARLGAGASFKSFTASHGGALTRNEVVLDLQGDEAAAHVAGVFLGEGKTHSDDTVFVTHDAVDCESRQVFKKVLRNGAVGVFQGKILVQPDAQKTDGYQISQSLLLDDDSQFLAKPELEIYADDVACSHGSTSGAIDEDALFYLRARGVEKTTAQNLLVLAFLAEALEEIADESLAEAVEAQLARWQAAGLT